MKEAEIVVIVDPMDSYHEKLIETVHAVKEFKSVSIKILMHTTEEDTNDRLCLLLHHS